MATAPCSNCGALTSAGVAFCAECGAPVSSPTLPPVPAPGPAYTGPGQVGAKPAAQQPAYQGVPPYQAVPAYPVDTVATKQPPPPSSRNTAAGAIALFAVVLVLIGTFLPIVEFNGLGGALDESLNGWNSDIHDGPIHAVVCIAPLVMGILALMNRARVAVKIVLIISALIGFFWLSIRYADISGSLEENGTGAFVAAVADPGVGLYLMTLGWVLVLVAGLVAKAGSPRPVAAPYGQPYQPPPAV